MSRAYKLFRGAQFAYFTSTKVQILTQKTLLDMGLRHLPVLDVQNRVIGMLARENFNEVHYSVYLLNGYKSTHTDAEGAAGDATSCAACVLH